MSATILDGRAVRDARLPELKARFEALFQPPTLVIMQVGERKDTGAYVKAKKAFGEKLGVTVKHIKLDQNVSQHDLLAKIRECNEDSDVKGIVVQLPVPPAIDQDSIVETISPAKDVDGLTSTNVRGWLDGNEDAILPATARGVKELLEHYKISLFGKHVVVVGRSMLVGKPLAAFCLNENASVTVCHSKTVDLASQTRMADVLIVAAGKVKLIGADYVKEGAVVVDVGINTVTGQKLEDEIEETKLVGDVDFDAVVGKVSAISPVPGGVGPMTVLALFENLIKLIDNINI